VGAHGPGPSEKTESSEPSKHLDGRNATASTTQKPHDSKACRAVRPPLGGALVRDGTDLVVFFFVPFPITLRRTPDTGARCLPGGLRPRKYGQVCGKRRQLETRRRPRNDRTRRGGTRSVCCSLNRGSSYRSIAGRCGVGVCLMDRDELVAVCSTSIYQL